MASARGDPRSTLVDTGFLAALFLSREPRHTAARRWLDEFDGQLLTVGAVLTEAAYFIRAADRTQLADLAASDLLTILEPDRAGYGRVSTILARYADRDPDWADACLVWAAEQSGVRRIVTIDESDFLTYRIHGRTPFDLVRWRDADS